MNQFGGVTNFAVLPGRLKSARMRKAAGGKGGISQLPEQPVIVTRVAF